MKLTRFLGVIAYCSLISAPVFGAANFPPDLTISLPGAPAEVTFGEEFSYQILVDNIGEDSASNVALTLNLPAEGNFVSISTPVGNCLNPIGQAPNLQITCQLGILAAASPITLTLTWQAPELETSLVLNAKVVGTGEVIDTEDNNSAEAVTEVLAPADQGGCSLHPAGKPSLNIFACFAAGFMVLASMRLAKASKRR